MKPIRMTLAAVAAVFVIDASHAADLALGTPSVPVLPVSSSLAADFFEVRGGVFWHQFFGPRHETESSVSLNGEVVLPGPFRQAGTRFEDVLFAPRFHVGGMLNTEGLTSYGYAGLTWTFDLMPSWYVDVGFGAAVSDGKTRYVPDRINVGCQLGFHETFSLGYRWSENWSTMLTFTHVSNANICPPNHGINTLGVRTSYRF